MIEIDTVNNALQQVIFQRLLSVLNFNISTSEGFIHYQKILISIRQHKIFKNQIMKLSNNLPMTLSLRMSESKALDPRGGMRGVLILLGVLVVWV